MIKRFLVSMLTFGSVMINCMRVLVLGRTGGRGKGGRQAYMQYAGQAIVAQWAQPLLDMVLAR